MSVSICETCQHKGHCNGAIVGRADLCCTGCSRYNQALPITNADRIRAMSDEEIADFFWRDPARIYFKTPKETLDWLKQEAGND